ncbi:Motile sperm domain-containing protein 1 [Amphibalanus amphitrite]|uniref:Motile sperm domain-containing protein 1 n=1 Tax=Amphibalanus amphitrite TaxID=1232801 RepID=A0A6A4VEI9_AMPAM|nr:Motile sperm domain-containing protein 1 [Amphibalanus amphitrite]
MFIHRYTMASRKTSGKGSLKYPVFVFPSALNFYMDDPGSLKQVITLYNPYDIGITFKVYANQPSKYKVMDPIGSIKARCCIDIVVRHVSPSLQNVNVSDKFRVDIVEIGQKELIGRTYIPSTLLPGRPPADDQDELEHEQEREGFHSALQEARLTTGGQQAAADVARAARETKGGYNASEVSQHHCLVVAAALVCIAALLLPTAGETTQSLVPPQLHLSTQVKLAFAYGLGLLTMALLRPA